MTRCIPILALLGLLLALLALTTTTTTRAAGPTARLILIESPGETFTPAQAAEARASALAALAWWDAAATAAGLAAPGLTLAPTETIQVADPFAPGPWLAPLVTWESATVELYVVANHAGRRLLAGGYTGYAAPGYRAAVAVAAAPGGLAPVIAHELGHVLYDLPDRAGPACALPDVMCLPGPAYAAGVIGCGSLATLGALCPAAAVPWRAGHVATDDTASWFTPAVPTRRPVATVDRGQVSVGCVGDEEPCFWAVSAWGGWTELRIDGVVIWQRGRVWLPGVWS